MRIDIVDQLSLLLTSICISAMERSSLLVSPERNSTIM